MVGRSFFPATVTAVFMIFIQYIVSGTVQYATTNGNAVLDPKIPPGRLTGILWKHNNHKAVEWDSPSDLTGYREFKDTTSLNTVTGELTIHGMTSGFSGEYVAEFTIDMMASQHVFIQSVEVIDPVSQLEVGCEKNDTIFTLTCSATGPMIEYLLSGPGQEGAPWSKQPIVAPFDATTESVNHTCSAKNPVSERSRVLISKDCNSPAVDESLITAAIVVLVLAGVLIAVGFVIFCICKKRGSCGNRGDIESGKKGRMPKDNNDVSLNEPLNPVQRNNSGDIEIDEKGDVKKTSTPTKDPSAHRFDLQSPSKASWNNNVSLNEKLQHVTPCQRNSSVRLRAALIDQGIYLKEEEMANETEMEDTTGLELGDRSNVSTEKLDSLIGGTIITTGEASEDETLLETEEEGQVNSSLLHRDPASQPPPKPPRCLEIHSSDVIGQNLHDRLLVPVDCGKHDNHQEVEEASRKGSEEAKEEYEASRKARGQSEGEGEKEKEGMMRESKKEEERKDENVNVEGRKGDQDEASDEEEGTEGGEREEEEETQAQVEDEDSETNRGDEDDDDDDEGENMESEGTTRETGEAGKEEGSEAGSSDGEDDGGGKGSGRENSHNDSNLATVREGEKVHSKERLSDLEDEA